MKKAIYAISMAALMMAAACQKEEAGNQTGAFTLTATLEQQAEDVKTSLDQSNNVVWAVGDEIKVFDNTGKYCLMEAQSEGKVVQFKSTSAEDGFDYDNLTCAVYPASAATGYSEGVVSLDVPAVQVYSENSFSKEANIAVAEIVGTNAFFKNACGVLKLSLNGAFPVAKIELIGNNGEKLHGAFTVDLNFDDFVGMVASGNPDDAEKKVSLDCTHFNETGVDVGNGYVMLDPSPIKATSFYFVVPVNVFGDASNGGFSATISSIFGDVYKANIFTHQATNIINRSSVRAMPQITCEASAVAIPEEYQQVEYIQNTNASQVIKTGFKVTDGFGGTTVWFGQVGMRDDPIELTGSRCLLCGYTDITKSHYFEIVKQSGKYYIGTMPGGSPASGLEADDYLGTLKEALFYIHGTTESGVNAIVQGSYVKKAATSYQGEDQKDFVLFGGIPDTWKGVHQCLGINGLTYKGEMKFFFVPCYVKDGCTGTDEQGNIVEAGTIGMYDFVTGRLFVNRGDGVFGKGPDVID